MSTTVINPNPEPLISVIIPTYNRAHTLPRAVDSVLAQTFRNFELIVVDDSSTDASDAYLDSLLAAPAVDAAAVRVLRNKKNLGVSASRNRAIENSRGEWLAFLDSDDEWLPQKLSMQMDFLTRHNRGGRDAYIEGLRLVHGEEIWIRNGVRVNAMNKHQKSGGRIFKRCVDLCCISPSAVLLHRSLLADVGLFREDFPVCEDYELWLRISAFEAVGFIEEPLIKKYGGHEDQLSRSVVGMDLWRLRALLPFVKEDFVRRDYGSLDEGRIGIGTGIGIDTGAGLGAGTGACLTKDIHVRDLLSGTFNEEFALISEDERAYALVVALQRIEILRKGAVKHANAELLSELDEIDLMLKV